MNKTWVRKKQKDGLAKFGSFGRALHSHKLTGCVSSTVGSTVPSVVSTLLASRKFCLLCCLPSTGLQNGLTHLGGPVHFMIQKDNKRPTQGCRNYYSLRNNGWELELPEVAVRAGNVDLGQEAGWEAPENTSSPETPSSLCEREGFGYRRGLLIPGLCGMVTISWKSAKDSEAFGEKGLWRQGDLGSKPSSPAHSLCYFGHIT